MKNYKFTINGSAYEVEIKQLDDATAAIEVNGTPYEVEIHREKKVSKTPTVLRPVSPASGPGVIDRRSQGTVFSIRSPLPGIILELLVKNGDIVRKGDKLLKMEAMKMENMVLAEKEGVIQSIKVKAGDSVLQGDVLFEAV
jgi:glutaconyl-CoA/methylmalonyl-CoA decarboxylase subunit gamma